MITLMMLKMTDPHGSVIDRCQGGLKMGRLAFLEDNVLQRMAKLGGLGHCLLLLGCPLKLGLQIFDLFKGIGVIAVQKKSASG